MPMAWCMCGDQKATLGVLLLLCGFQGSNSACQVCVPAGEGGVSRSRKRDGRRKREEGRKEGWDEKGKARLLLKFPQYWKSHKI